MFDSYGDGWEDKTATVLVNNDGGLEPVWFDFEVQPNAFDYPEENSYEVYSEPQGGGSLVNNGESSRDGPATPASIPNICGTVTFTSPANFAVIAAGSIVPISLISNADSNQLIPSNFYGDACIFSVIAPLDLFTPTNTDTIT